jgi:hypothetical protein
MYFLSSKQCCSCSSTSSQEGTPFTYKSSVFQCTSNISARLTPVGQLARQYILDFVDNNGSRIEKCTGLVVFDGQVVMEPVGRKNSPELEVYFLQTASRYEIHLRKTLQLIKSITFRSEMTVQCT